MIGFIQLKSYHKGPLSAQYCSQYSQEIYQQTPGLVIQLLTDLFHTVALGKALTLPMLTQLNHKNQNLLMTIIYGKQHH